MTEKWDKCTGNKLNKTTCIACDNNFTVEWRICRSQTNCYDAENLYLFQEIGATYVFDLGLYVT